MIIDPIPSTINETSLRTTAMKPIANSHPKIMATPMSNRFLTRRNENTSSKRINVTDMDIAHWLSFLI